MDGINTGDTAWVLISPPSGADDDPRPGLLLRRHGPQEERALHAEPELHSHGAHQHLQWILFGFTLAFGTSLGGLIGGLNFLGLSGVGANPTPTMPRPPIPFLLFAAYQMMFAIITPALITGAFVERIRFKTFLIFSLLWATLVYDPVAHWVWGVGGILRNMGALDFAGGTVVHITAGFSALALASVIRARQGFSNGSMEPHNIPFSVLGAGLLWMGWFGFNGGSCAGRQRAGSQRAVTTNTAAAAAALVWMLLSLARQQAQRAGHRHRRGGGPGGHHACGRLCDPARGHGHRRTGRPH